MNAKRPIAPLLLSLSLLLFLAACTAGGGLPTPLPVAQLPTETPTGPATRVLPTLLATATPAVPPTSTLPPTNTPGPSPTATAFVTATPFPTLRPIPTNTPFPTRTPRPSATPIPPPPVPGPTASPTPDAAGWSGAYYANRDLSGQPALTRNDADLAFTWGTGAPASGLPADGFSARWSRSLAFEAAVYRFNAIADDGVRAWLDGQLIIDQWHDATSATHSTERALSAGAHSLKVEYYENLGDARLQFWWEKADAVTQWSGQYFANRDLSGAPALTRNDAVLGFAWGAAAPAAGLPADGFSARWTRSLAFDAGTYRFYALADDGIRLYLDDLPLIDQWHDAGNVTYAVDHVVAAGTHTIRAEVYENLGDAFASVWWERLDDDGFWFAELYANVDLSGRPARLRYDSQVDFSWGNEPPADGMPADGFSGRWLGTGVFEPGRYRFHVIVDDGIRLWVDNALIVDDWRDGAEREIVLERDMPGGAFPIRVEYFDRTGGARLRVWWEMLTRLQRR